MEDGDDVWKKLDEHRGEGNGETQNVVEKNNYRHKI